MIAIVDCNSFYCSCERLFRPDLLEKPVVVLSNNDGCIISRTDEAKELGIAMGAPYFMVKEMMEANDVTGFSSNYNLYGDMSLRVMDILRLICGEKNVEVYSIDEAFVFLDHVPEEKLMDVARRMRDQVAMWTGIPVSIGIAETKTLAKLANRNSKKNKAETGCISILSKEHRKASLEQCEVKDIWGIGKANVEKLANAGVANAWQLAVLPADWIQKNMGGVVGERLLRELNGERSLFLQEELTKKKMITTSRMFGRRVYEIDEIKEAVATYVSRAAEKLRRQQCATTMLNVFVMVQDKTIGKKFIHGPSVSADCNLPEATNCTNELIAHAMKLVDKIYKQGPVYKKAGVILSGLVPENVIQKNIFYSEKKPTKKLMGMLDNINFSMRDDVVKFAATGTRRFWKMRQQFKSKRYTTRWEELLTVS